jgi:hypothetical protein
MLGQSQRKRRSVHVLLMQQVKFRAKHWMGGSGDRDSQGQEDFSDLKGGRPLVGLALGSASALLAPVGLDTRFDNLQQSVGQNSASVLSAS